MAQQIIAPAYKLAVYAPRSVDATEVTVLTPAAGAPHSDAFQVTTLAALAGWKPYLNAPKGRRGRFNFLTKKTETGTLTCRFLDKRTGTTNAARWVTAFIGDTKGNLQQLGLKVRVWESLDGGATWGSGFFTGRVERVAGEGDNWIDLEFREEADELNASIFVGRPASSITYAALTPLAPLGVLSSYGALPITKKFRGRYQAVSSGGLVALATFGTSLHNEGGTGYPNPATPGAWVSKLLADLASWSQSYPLDQNWVARYDDDQVRIISTDIDGARAGQTFEYGVKRLAAKLTRPNIADVANGGSSHYGLYLCEPVQLPSGDALPAAGVTCEFYLVRNGPPTKNNQLLIGDVHPVQLFSDLLDGKFGYLSTPSTPRRAIATKEATSFAALIADTSFTPVRFPIGEPAKCSSWAEEKLCRATEFGWRINGAGEVEVFDCRLTSASAAVSTITDADLTQVDGPVQPTGSRAEAITRVDATYGYDQIVDVAAAWSSGGAFYEGETSLVRAKDASIQVLDFGDRARDMGDKPATMKFEGFRYSDLEFAPGSYYGLTFPIGQPRSAVVRAQALRAIDRLRQPYGTGPFVVGLTCRRTANVTVAKQGTLHIVNVTRLPNPATNQRGGARLMRCLERDDDGLEIKLAMLDLGSTTVCVVPVLANPVAGADASHEVSVSLTRNASSEPIEYQIAVTDTATAVRPAATSPLWRRVTYATANGAVVAGDLPAGARVWPRARSVAGTTETLKLPSDWAFPATQYLDTTAVSAIAGLAASSITGTTALLTWTAVADDVEVFVTTGAAPGTWTDVFKIGNVPGGVAQFTIEQLTLNTTHTVGLRRRDRNGGVSTMATVSVTTLVTQPVAPAPLSLEALV